MSCLTARDRGVFHTLRRVYHSKRFLWGLVCIGMVLHIHQYLFNRSLWVDEAALALNILDKSYGELLLPLSHNQQAPPGFLLAEKMLVDAFGAHEYVLRLIPLLCAIAALVLFVPVAYAFVSSSYVPLAVGLFSVSSVFIYHSSTLKQYSSDLFFTLLLYYLAIKFLVEPLAKHVTVTKFLLFALVGIIAIWCSHPAIFVLAGIGSYIGIQWWRQGEWKKMGLLTSVCILWAGNLFILYRLSLRSIADREHLQQFWDTGFVPWPPTFQWFWNKLFEVSGYYLEISGSLSEHLLRVGRIAASTLGLSPSVGLSLAEMSTSIIPSVLRIGLLVGAAVLSVLGAGTFLLSKQRIHSKALLLPGVFCLSASWLHKYPFENRLLLFLLPVFVLMLSEGAGCLIRASRVSPLNIFAYILIGSVCVYSLQRSGFHLFYPRKHEEARPVLQYARNHRQANEPFYVYYASELVFNYYSRLLGIKTSNVISGIESRRNWNRYLDDMQQLRGHKRVWLFFSHAYSEEAFFIAYLNSIGIQLDKYTDVRASVYLYDLQ